MKQYFKTFVNFKQNDWIELLFMTKFVYNNNKHASIWLSSFEIMQNYISRMFFEKFANFKIKSKFVKKHAEEFAKLLKVFKINLIHAQKQQIKYKNTRTKNVKNVFKIDNYVNVNDKNIRIKRNKKFEWKFFDSFKIFNEIEIQIYRINISKRWRIYNVFYIWLFEKMKFKREKKVSLQSTYQSKHIAIDENEITKKIYDVETIENEEKVSLQSTYQSENIAIDENKITKKIYDVETIENSKIFKENQVLNKSYNESNLYYFIRWKNYEKRIWEFVSIIKHLRSILRKFHTKNSKKNDVNKLKNRRNIRRQMNVIFMMKQLIRKQNH